MKPKYKKALHDIQEWSDEPYYDVVYFGRNVAVFHFPGTGPPDITDHEWREFCSNSVWLRRRNPMCWWDKPKKTLLATWKRSGRIRMGTKDRKFG